MKKIFRVTAAIFLAILLAPFIPSGNNDGKEGGEWAIQEEGMYHIPADEYFTPKNMTIEDDAFHPALRFHVETWYYEAIFTNGCSTVLIITLLSSDGMNGMALAGFYIYREGHMEVMERLPSFSFHASSETPFIKICDCEIVKGYIDGYGKLVYDIFFEANGNGMKLQFTNKTRGWVGEMGMGWWLAVPSLNVTGEITMNGTSVKVNGTGYHDHNIFSLCTPLMERGYMDGKILRDSFSMVWGNMMHSIWNTDVFSIFSENGDYTAVSHESIEIAFPSFTYDHGRRIPTECSISINDRKNSIFVELHINTVDFHHIRLPFLHYWRYHVRIEGNVKTLFHEETIDENGIMELMLY